MKKLYVLLALCLFPLLAFSQDSGQGSMSTESGFYQYTQEIVGYDVVVSFANIDFSIKGKLIRSYPDGILVSTFMKEEIFIRREAIAYIQVKKGK